MINKRVVFYSAKNIARPVMQYQVFWVVFYSAKNIARHVMQYQVFWVVFNKNRLPLLYSVHKMPEVMGNATNLDRVRSGHSLVGSGPKEFGGCPVLKMNYSMLRI